VHDRGARLGQTVDERRLADVREADDRDGAQELVAVTDLCLAFDLPIHRGHSG
jgi:hypothetical protein